MSSQHNFLLAASLYCISLQRPLPVRRLTTGTVFDLLCHSFNCYQLKPPFFVSSFMCLYHTQISARFVSQVSSFSVSCFKLTVLAIQSDAFVFCTLSIQLFLILSSELQFKLHLCYFFIVFYLVLTLCSLCSLNRLFELAPVCGRTTQVAQTRALMKVCYQ